VFGGIHIECLSLSLAVWAPEVAKFHVRGGQVSHVGHVGKQTDAGHVGKQTDACEASQKHITSKPQLLDQSTLLWQQIW